MEEASARIFAAISMLLLAILACQPGPAPAPVIPSPVISIGDALTFTVQTLTVQVPTVPLPTPIVFVETIPPTFTLEAIGLTTIPSTNTLIPSPMVPMASVSVVTNCRTGPGQVYDRVAVVDVGMVVQIVGKYSPDNYWIVLMPSGSQCWLWGQYASTAGNLGSLVEMVPPPRPTALPLPTASSVPAATVGAVTGVITDLRGSSLTDVLVTAQLSKRTSTTNSGGNYVIEGLPPGREFITIEDSSHKPKFQSVNILAGNTVTANFVIDPVVFDKLVAAVNGLVLINSQPAAGVNVSVWAKSASAVTDSNGRYRIEFEDEAYIPNTTLLVLAELGNLRGGAEWNPFQTATAPDIILLPR